MESLCFNTRTDRICLSKTPLDVLTTTASDPYHTARGRCLDLLSNYAVRRRVPNINQLAQNYSQQIDMLLQNPNVTRSQLENAVYQNCITPIENVILGSTGGQI